MFEKASSVKERFSNNCSSGFITVVGYITGCFFCSMSLICLGSLFSNALKQANNLNKLYFR